MAERRRLVRLAQDIVNHRILTMTVSSEGQNVKQNGNRRSNRVKNGTIKKQLTDLIEANKQRNALRVEQMNRALGTL